jgi:hypothetical protein
MNLLSITVFITSFLLATPCWAFFEQFFQQQHQQQGEESHQDKYLNKECSEYLCPDTLSCVKTPKDCPCPFPNSQIKCLIGASYVCISKGSRDCQFVNNAYNGLV